MNVDHSGLCFFALLVRQVAGIGNQSIQSGFRVIIFDGDRFLLCQYMQPFCFQLRMIFDIRADLVLSDDRHHGSANAYG